jgi:hypothetical protein
LAEAARHRWWRIARLAIIGIIAEAALFALERLAPAMSALVRPMYPAVAGVLVYGLWHAMHSRTGGDRRREERRQPTPTDGAG